VAARDDGAVGVSAADWEQALNAEQRAVLGDLRRVSHETHKGWVTAALLATLSGRNRRSMGTKLAGLERAGVVESRYDARNRVRHWRPKIG
jgi:hypothetical protein